jgi:hypothetical protein
VARLAPAYQPRRPTETVLYRVVRDTLETFLAQARETYAAPLPHYVERELRAYVRCGVFAHGFTRCHCDTCGSDLLVAFSCKGRGLCPSCAGRRMANTGAHLVDRVLPDVPVRQFVLSLPYELRPLAAFKPDVLGALARIFVEAVFGSYRARAEREGFPKGQPGAITFVQRFGGSLNLNVHFHTIFLDGVFVRDAGNRVAFHPTSAPAAAELAAIARRVHRRAMAWLARHGYLDRRPSEERLDAPDPSAIEACAAIAVRRGTFSKLATDEDQDAGHEDDATRLHFVGQHEGFNLHAGVRIGAGDDLGRERLCRYAARPALALDRLRRLRDGRLAYQVKYARRGAAKHRVMTSLELLARLSALIPPPRHPLVRFHGVLAPHSSWRRFVVPAPPASSAGRPACASKERTIATPPKSSPKEEVMTKRPPHRSPGERLERPLGGADRVQRSPSASVQVAPRAPAPMVSDVLQVVPNVISVGHWNRLHDGALLATSSYVDWASLLRRTFEVDVLKCAKCGGRLRVLSVVTERDAVRRILDHLGVPSDAAPLPRARDPDNDAAASASADDV